MRCFFLRAFMSLCAVKCQIASSSLLLHRIHSINQGEEEAAKNRTLTTFKRDTVWTQECGIELFLLEMNILPIRSSKIRGTELPLIKYIIRLYK